MSEEKNVGRYSYISEKDRDDHDARVDKLRAESHAKLKEGLKFRDNHFRVHHSDMHKVAEELRMEGKGSGDPMYNESHKNK